MSAFDYAVLAILLVSTLIGVWRGLLSEVLALAAWVIAFLVARQFGGLLAPLLASWVVDASLRLGIAYVLLFVLSLLLLGLLRLLLRELLHASGLGLADRSLGGIFGALRGVLLCVLVVLLAGLTDLPKSPWWREALLAPPLETAVLFVSQWLPDGMAKRIHFR